MTRFTIQDLRTIENAPTSPGSLRTKVAAMIEHSTTFRARVAAVNPETGEYRIVLHGTLDREDTNFEAD